MELDPEILASLTAIGIAPAGDAAPPPSIELLEAMRSAPARTPYAAAPPVGIDRDELGVPGPAGAPEVAVRIYRRADRAPRPVPALVWFHGGGYVLGSYDMDAPILDPLVARTGCVALSVDYRLAPEVPFPGPLEDCFAVVRFASENAAELGIDRERLAVGGLSAGAGLAAAVALRARERTISLAHQHLIYPMIDDAETTPSSCRSDLAVWSRAMNAFAWRCYLGELHGGDDIPGTAAAARATDLRGLPPAYIHVGALDGFVREDVDYAMRLLAAGVPTELHVFPGAPHAFDLLAPEAAVSKAATAVSHAALARVLRA
jgi:acetyl esterase/lipase